MHLSFHFAVSQLNSLSLSEHFDHIVSRRAFRNPDPGVKNVALSRAAARGQEATVRLLLELKADVNARVHNGTALQRAAWYGHEAVVRLLLEHKVDVDARDIFGGTALHQAAYNGHE